MSQTDRKFRRKYREERCCERFVSWLKSNAMPYPKRPEISWNYEPCGPDKAPDFLFTIDGKQYVVEVTIVPHKEILAGGYFPEEAVNAAMRDILRHAQVECEGRNSLFGLYSVHFTKGIENLALGTRRRNIVKQIVAYVEETQANYEAPLHAVAIDGTQICTIQKIHTMVSAIILARTTDRSGGVPLCEILQEAIATKVKSLNEISDPYIRTLPRILLLDADERSEPPADWRTCVAESPLLEEFHTIMVIPGISYVFALCVGELSWPME